MDTEKKKRFIVNIIFFAIIAALLVAICKFLLPAFLPFLIAFLIAAIIQVPAKKIAKEDRKREKWLSIFFCILFYSACFLAVGFVGTKVVQKVVEAVMAAPSFYNEKVVPLFTEIATWLEQRVSSVDAGVSHEIEKNAEELVTNVGQYISEVSVNVLQWLSGGVTGIPGFIIKLVVMIVATFFMAADFTRIMEFFANSVPKRWQKYVKQGEDYVKNVLIIYIRSYSILFCITFVELSVGMLIFRIPYAILVAFGIAIFDILPVLGTGGILLPWAVILFLLGNIPLGVGMIVLYLIIIAVRNTIEPRLVGKQIGLHPLATLISMFVGLELLGLAGMVIFPVTLAVLTNMKKNGVELNFHLFD